MELNWLQSFALGLVSGLTEILPVSSQAHQTILLKFIGETGHVPVTRLVIHVATFLTVLLSVWGQIGRIRRQQQLVRMPRRRRNRPVEMAALMDGRIIRTALVPVLLMLLLGSVTRRSASLLVVAAAALVNAALLYLPSVLPTADKDSRLVSPLESILMGLGAGSAVIPGMSSVGACYSVGILHGMDKKYMLHLALMMQLIYNAGMIFYDVLDIVDGGAFSIGPRMLLGWGVAGAAAAMGALLGLHGLDRAARKNGLTGFSFYSFGLALFAFILYLVV